jgi:hypothetical protein
MNLCYFTDVNLCYLMLFYVILHKFTLLKRQLTYSKKNSKNVNFERFLKKMEKQSPFFFQFSILGKNALC